MSVSVIVYCYKNEVYLDQALVTLANQEGCPWEAIIINDGCFFSLEPHLTPLVDKPVKTIKFSKPQGMLRSLIAGLAISRYNACIFQRGCDFHITNRLKTQLRLFSRIGVDSIFSIPKVLTEKGLVKLPSENLVGNDSTRVIAELLKWKDLGMGVSSLMFNRQRLSTKLFTECLRNTDLCPSRIGTELFIMRELCGENMIVNEEPLAVVNCKRDVSFFEQDDYEVFNPSNSSN